MARPKKEPDEQRSESTRATLTVSEKQHVQEQAAAAGLSEMEYTRRRILGYSIPPARPMADAALISEINRIGVNVNQLALATHRGSDFQVYWRAVGQQVETVLKKVVANGS